MAKVKILAKYYQKRFEAYGKDYFWVFKDEGWEIEIHKTHPCFNGLKPNDLYNKDYYDNENMEWKRVWELEFDSEAGYKPDKDEEKWRRFGKDEYEYITVKYKSGEREREREQNHSITRTNCWIGGSN